MDVQASAHTVNVVMAGGQRRDEKNSRTEANKRRRRSKKSGGDSRDGDGVQHDRIDSRKNGFDKKVETVNRCKNIAWVRSGGGT